VPYRQEKAGFSQAAATCSILARRIRVMYHTIEFTVDYTVDLETSPKHWREQVLIPKGAQRRAQIRPYVVETDDGPIEVADLFFEDGTATRMVPFGAFTFAH
jgi:hypothetical protein